MPSQSSHKSQMLVDQHLAEMVMSNPLWKIIRTDMCPVYTVCFWQESQGADCFFVCNYCFWIDSDVHVRSRCIAPAMGKVMMDQIWTFFLGGLWSTGVQENIGRGRIQGTAPRICIVHTIGRSLGDFERKIVGDNMRIYEICHQFFRHHNSKHKRIG